MLPMLPRIRRSTRMPSIFFYLWKVARAGSPFGERCAPADDGELEHR